MNRTLKTVLEVVAVIAGVLILAGSLAFAGIVLASGGAAMPALVMAGVAAIAAGAGLACLVLRHWVAATLLVLLALVSALALLMLGGLRDVAPARPLPPLPASRYYGPNVTYGFFKAQTPVFILPGVTRWPGGEVPVCWISQPGDTELVEAVSEAETAWERVANVHFADLGVCAADAPANAVRLSPITNAGHPDTAVLGQPAPGARDGVSVALSFPSRDTCSRGGDPVILRACVYGTAVHEFGHVLGLPDVSYSQGAPPACLTSGAHPALAIPYDPRSVMNTCNSAHIFGRLSDSDIATARALYGREG